MSRGASAALRICAVLACAVALEGAALWLDLSLAGADRARVDLIDLTGRRALTRALDSRRDARQRLAVPCGVSPGIYFPRVVQGGRSGIARLVVLR